MRPHAITARQLSQRRTVDHFDQTASPGAFVRRCPDGAASRDSLRATVMVIRATSRRSFAANDETTQITSPGRTSSLPIHSLPAHHWMRSSSSASTVSGRQYRRKFATAVSATNGNGLCPIGDNSLGLSRSTLQSSSQRRERSAERMRGICLNVERRVQSSDHVALHVPRTRVLDPADQRVCIHPIGELLLPFTTKRESPLGSNGT